MGALPRNAAACSSTSSRGTERRAGKTKRTFSAYSYPRRSGPHNCNRTAARGPGGGRYFIYRPPRDGKRNTVRLLFEPDSAIDGSRAVVASIASSLGSRRWEDVFRSAREVAASTLGGEDEPVRRQRSACAPPRSPRCAPASGAVRHPRSRVRTWRSPWTLGDPTREQALRRSGSAAGQRQAKPVVFQAFAALMMTA